MSLPCRYELEAVGLRLRRLFGLISEDRRRSCSATASALLRLRAFDLPPAAVGLDASLRSASKPTVYEVSVIFPVLNIQVAYTHSGFQTGAPYRVINDDHWIFAGTGLKNEDLFGMSSLHERCPGGASAHELDKISPDSPDNIRHLAKGANPATAGADLTIYDTPSGGSVFAAGSLCWTLSLPIDDGTSAITRNVLRRFLERRT